MHHLPVEKAVPGDFVGINVGRFTINRRAQGLVLCNVEDLKYGQGADAQRFLAQIVVVKHCKFKVGYAPTLNCHTRQVACVIEKIVSKVDKKTGEVLEEEPKSLKTSDSALVWIIPTNRILVEEFSKCAPLGRFILRDNHGVTAIGIVKEVIRHKFEIVN